LNETVMQMGADPTLGITLKATFATDQFSREAQEDLEAQGFDLRPLLI